MPQGWKSILLGEIVELISGRDLSPSDYSDNPIGFPYITGASNFEKNHIAVSRWTDKPVTISHKGDLLITCKGTIGKIAFNEIGDIHIARQIMALRIPLNLNSQFVRYYIESRLPQIKNNANSLIPGIDRNVMLRLRLDLPPYLEQCRIVAEIEKWFTLIDVVEQGQMDLATLIEQAKRKILDLAIHGKLVPQDPTDEPAIDLLRHINSDFQPCDTSHYENLPQGWCECKLEDVVDYEQPQAYIVESTNYSDNYETPVLTAGKSFVIGYTNETKGIFQDLPVIIFDDFTTDSKYVDFPFKVKSSAMKVLHVKKGINIQFIALLMSITRLTGDTHKRYWISEYSKLSIMLPPKHEQDAIVKVVCSIFKQLDSISQTLTD